MPAFSRRQMTRYGFAVVLVMVAALVRRALDPALGEGNVLFITAYPAVVAAAWWGGRGPGLVATMLAVATTGLFVVRPIGELPTDGVFWSGALLFAAMGVVITSLIDSTRRARREAEAQATALQLREEWLRVTLTSIGDGVIATDADGAITLINTVARDLTGWGDDAIGQPLETVFRIINESSRAPVPTPIAKVLSLGRIVGLANHTVLIARDGGEHPIEDSAAPIRDGRNAIIGVVMVFRDASAQRRAERAERRTAERLELALDAGGLGVWEWDLRTDEVWWSDAVARIHGMDPESFGGTLAAFRELVHPDDRERVGLLIAKAVEDCTKYTVQFRTITPAGELRWISGQATVFCDDDGKAVRMVGVSIDVTRQRTTEAALLDADRRKDEFLATLAHELRNPLAPIRNAIEVTRLIDSDPPEPVQRAREMMERQVQHMTRLLDDLLDVSRITRDRLELRREPVLLTTVLRSAVEASERMLRSDGRSFETHLPDAAIWLDADHTRLAQVFANLLNNSAKFTQPGGSIALGAAVDGSYIVITVRDDGIGIDEDDRLRLFDLFAQASSPNGPATDGLGIGLTIARRLVELHGGSLTAHSHGLGTGSTFTVRLPMASQPNDQSGNGASVAGNASPALRVLVADDNVDATETLAMLLRLWGHEVATATDGHAAVAVAASFRPQVALLDIGMPGLDGYDVARHLRTQPEHAAIRLVAVTGWGQESDRARALDAGFDDHLTKPVDPTSLGLALGIAALGGSVAR